MIFLGEPNLYVRISNKYIQRATGKRGFYFNSDGEFETENDILIKLLEQSFKVKEIKPENNDSPNDKISCKKCGQEFENQGHLMAHYRKEHPKGAGKS